MNYFLNKEERANHARLWTRKMENEHSDEIKTCIENSKIYSPNSTFSQNDEQKEPMSLFSSTGTIEAIKVLPAEQYGKIAILNYASYKNPGGMFIEGSSAQEEMICHSTFLYNVLKEFVSYYDKNQKNLNGGLYYDRAIYSPSVKVFFDDEVRTVDIITCAAPNKSCLRYGHFTEKENFKALAKRCKFIKNIAEENNVDTLVLGAWGCGVFKQNPQEVADCFKKAFETSSIKCVVYAVPGNNQNAQVFAKEFHDNQIWL